MSADARNKNVSDIAMDSHPIGGTPFNDITSFKERIDFMPLSLRAETLVDFLQEVLEDLADELAKEHSEVTVQVVIQAE